MKLEPECVGCMFNQILNALRELKPELTRKEILETQKVLLQYFNKIDLENCTTYKAGRFIYETISEIVGEEDPYKKVKKEYNEIALTYYPKVREIILASDDPVFEALGAAALGNTIDMASQHNIELLRDIEELSPNKLVVNDYFQFKKDLKNSKTLLILGDNAGEIVFDKLLIETLNKQYPNIKIYYAVRSAPIINDATIEDARYISLTEIVEVIESSPSPGIDFDHTSDRFNDIFQEVDLILSKGQGNFESLFQLKFQMKKIYYLLKAKCNLMERLFNVEMGSLILKKKEGDF